MQEIVSERKFFIVLLFLSIFIIMVIVTSLRFTDNFENNKNIETLKDIMLDPLYKKLEETDAFIISMSDTLFETAKKRLDDTALKNIKKFDAVKGSTLNTFIADTEYVTVKAHYDITVAENRRSHAELGTINAIGCYMSHITLWKQLADSDKDGMFIFETDALCISNVIVPTIKFLHDPETATHPHILFFGNFHRLDKDSPMKKIKSRFYGMQSYYITKEGAKRCLENAFPIEEQIDSYLSDLLLLSMKPNSGVEPLNFYIINLCMQYNVNGTSIQTKQIACDVSSAL